MEVKLPARQIRRGVHGDVGIGVGRIADHDDAHVAGGDFVERPPLLDEDLGVVHQQVLALHARSAGLGADQQGVVHVLERHIGIAGADHVDQQRESAVFELHHHALERALRLLHGQSPAFAG